MKRLCYLILLAMAVVFAMGCSQDVEIQEKDFSASVTYDEQVVSLLSKTSVKLFDGVYESDIGLTLEGKGFLLSNELSRKTGRNVSDSDVILSMEKMVDILGTRMESVSIPELVEPTEADLIDINADFPDLTQEEVIEHIDVIAQIYQDQVAALASDALLEDSQIIQVVARNSYNDGISISDQDLTWAEVRAILHHPFSALGLKKQREKALALSERYMGACGGVNNKVDAFRHAIWNVVMAKEGWGKKSAKMAWARDFATAHEKGANYVAKDSEMDLHNNAVGLAFYDKNSTKKYKKFLWWKIEIGVKEPSYEQAGTYFKGKANSAIFIDENQTADLVKKDINEVSFTELLYLRK